MASRTSWPGNVVFGEEATAALVTKIPGGMIAYETEDSNTTGITTVVDLIEVTVTIPADRIITVEGYYGRVSSLTASDIADFCVKESATQLAASRIDVGTVVSGSNGGATAYVSTAPFTPSAGSHTYKLTGELAQGTGTIQFRAASTSPAWIRVIDHGPSF